MTRHVLTPLPHKQGIEVIVGWDKPFGSYFAQVHGTHNGEAAEDDAEVDFLWVGTSRSEITNALDIIKLVAPYAHIPDDLYHVLCADAAQEGERHFSPIAEMLTDEILGD